MKTLATFLIGVGVGAAALYGAGSRFGNAGPGALATEGEQAESQALFWQQKNDGSERQAAFAFWRHHNHRDKGGVWQSTWLGVPTIQNPLDVWVTQEILHEVKPDFVVETGTHRGGSAALWATLLEQINPDARVITIDINERSEPARELPVVQRRVDFLVGSSTDPAIVSSVTEQVKGKKVVVILDSNHSRSHVLDELNAYAPIVPVGSYLIVQDTGIGEPAYGMNRAADGVRDFLATTDEFEVDRSREAYGITNNAAGFLRRIRG